MTLPGRYSVRITSVCFVALIVLGLLWEIWLAPLRPGGSWLVLKVVPLAVALPGIVSGRGRSLKLWSMLILMYLCEGLVRAVSDKGLSAQLALLETVLAAIAFLTILVAVKRLVQAPPASASQPALAPGSSPAASPIGPH